MAMDEIFETSMSLRWIKTRNGNSKKEANQLGGDRRTTAYYEFEKQLTNYIL
jgi:hypothetical protein